MRSTLQSQLAGAVLVAGDEGYDAARSVWNDMVDRRPRYIVRCASVADVATAVRFAHEHGLEIGIRCGGHGIVGHAVPHDGLMIDLRLLGDVKVDVQRRWARVEGGALLGALDRASQPHGLATTAGNVSHTGVGGLTLGGGMGWLARQHGLSCDNVVAFEVVTATGELVEASADSHPELYWALRGGGGNFGVVTAFEFVLHPEPGEVTTVEVLVPLTGAAPAMRHWRDLSASAPRQATFNALIDGDTVSLGFVWVGAPVEGRAQAEALAGALDDTGGRRSRIETMSYLQLQSREDDVKGHAWRRYWKGHYFSSLGDELIDALLDRSGAHLPAASLQAYGGAIADVADEATAFSRRDTAFEFVAASKWSDPREDESRMSAARRYARTLDRFASGAYVNVLGDEGQAGLRRAFTEPKLARLTAVKRAYDPDNVFHLNQNIPPGA
ncbi:MAG TPA: FAD-binding oxidoreductase [Agromyces sp.]|nr:FAD-binding oxidoreductase [Agromyces sp.]